MAGSDRQARRGRALAWLVAVAVVFGSCGGGDTASYDPISVEVDESRSSPLPERPAAVAEAAVYAPLDLSALGDNASSSELPSAIPAGLEVGFTEEGYPYRGSPEATVTMVEYSDYACPFCNRYTAQNVPALLEQYGVTGQVQFVIREFPLTSIHPTAPAGHTSALCAGEQGAELYWAVHDEIFARQDEWTGLSDPAEFFAGLAQGVGVEMTAYQECVTSGRHDATIADGIADAETLGFNGTPSFALYADDVEGTFTIVGAQALDVFTAYLDALLAGEAPAEPEPEPGEEPEPEGLPLWADVTTGLRPDPDRPGMNQAGDFYKGNPDAQLVVIEFSDFQCPFCRDHVLEVQPAVDEQFVETGQILWVYKHLPLAIHPLAPTAGAAAECAGDQGRFWEMHELLFETVEQWEAGDVNAELVALAGELGLDVAAFESCFTGRAALERVLADQADARGIITETPSFVLIVGERGALMEGSLPVDDFVANLEARLEQAADIIAGEE